MSRAKLAKTQAEFDEEAILQYDREQGRPFPMEELAQNLINQGWKVRIPSAAVVLTRRLKRRARELREVDPQKRKVRSMHAAKVSKIDEDGQQIFEVVWAHIKTMDSHHALTSFQQRYENHKKQDRALDRDMASYNDNNPNAAEHKIQKEMLFTLDEREEQVVETIKKKPAKKKPR